MLLLLLLLLAAAELSNLFGGEVELRLARSKITNNRRR